MTQAQPHPHQHAGHPHGAHDHAPHQHGAHEHGPHQHGNHAADDQAELLDLDAEVLAEHIASLVAWLPVDTTPRQIVDLGSGTGTGTFALLGRFPEAEITAVDSSPAHLQRLRERAEAEGVGDRVRTVQADLDAEWPELSEGPGSGAPDLVWASASMHHMADPDRALRKVRELLAPGGLFAVVELSGFPRFLPENAPEERPGLEERCHSASDRFHAARVPHRGADWGPKLAAAGFALAGERSFSVAVEGSDGPHAEAVGRYALSSLRLIRGTVADALSPADLAALDRLLDIEGPDSILRRNDLAVRTERQVWAARRED
ncbi:class I SAM-dependent methyltransferase [Streptomyces sp. ODS28]|uniref:class I SAM-dependent methyltransferase n=1 Tax=Streptomyces sp. ODS28 TaxID=3136688 RepID=UPI0031EEB912